MFFIPNRTKVIWNVNYTKDKFIELCLTNVETVCWCPQTKFWRHFWITGGNVKQAPCGQSFNRLLSPVFSNFNWNRFRWELSKPVLFFPSFFFSSKNIAIAQAHDTPRFPQNQQSRACVSCFTKFFFVDSYFYKHHIHSKV